MNPQSILLKGYYGFGNFGDDILMRCAFEELRRRFPNALIDVFSNYSPVLPQEKSEKEYNYYIQSILSAKVKIVDWTSIGHYDLIVHGGGGVFGSLENAGSLLPFIRRRVLDAPAIGKLAYFVRQTVGRRARLSADRTVACGVGIGMLGLLSRESLHYLEELASIDRLAVRDAVSLDRACQLGLGNVVKQFTDLAFGLNCLPLNVEAVRDKVGLIPCQGRAGTEALLDLAKTDPQRFKVVILDENHDRGLIQRSKSEGLDPIVWRPNTTAIREFLAEWNCFEFVMTNRAHGGIVSALMGVPPLLLASDFKLKSVHSMLPNGSVMIDPFSPGMDLLRELSCASDFSVELENGIKLDVTANRLKIQPMFEFVFN